MNMAGLPSVDDSAGWARLGRALRHRNFRLFFAGQSVSLVGTWMQQIGVGWLAYVLTGDPFLIGLVGFAGQIPGFFLVPFAGVFLDRWSKHRLILIAQVLLMVQALVLACLTPGILFWQLTVMSFLQGCLTAFDLPARQSFLPEMIEDRADLANAIALNSSMFHGARLIGPSLAALCIWWGGVQLCFLINGLSYLAVIASLVQMRLTPRGMVAGAPGPAEPIPPMERQTPDPRPGVLHGLWEGVRYAYRFRPIRAILLLVAVVSLFGAPYTVLLPLYAGEVFRGDASTFGFMVTAAGLGALTGAFYMAARKTVLGLGRIIIFACSGFALGLMIFSQSDILWLSLASLVLVGLGMMLVMASCNTIVQTLVDDDKRGRVMSLFTLAFTGLAPFGALLAGGVADLWGVRVAILIGGGVCLCGGLYFATRLERLRRLVRPIYVERGIFGQSSQGG
jgi:MFS family permease